jgi:hypothetical protein
MKLKKLTTLVLAAIALPGAVNTSVALAQCAVQGTLLEMTALVVDAVGDRATATVGGIDISCSQ